LVRPIDCADHQSPTVLGISALFLLQAGNDGPISDDAWQSAEKADCIRVANRPARQRRLARIYDRADRRTIGSTDPHILAKATLAHWLYIRSTGGGSYSWPKMASDYRTGLLAHANLSARDIKAMPTNSRPQIVRRILMAAPNAPLGEAAD